MDISELLAPALRQYRHNSEDGFVCGYDQKEIRKIVSKLKSDLDEADRRAGAAEREKVRLKESAQARRDWLRRAKEEAGYHDSVSFDTVWDETLKLAKGR
ncbi:hypothetical protein NX722_28615 [Endozoicomonas gorgoniicola]|uniref:Uncharacterized protein n=1 Tax=Endozoicomonas gorgoniicola TaxID=1234144 RepID=A0ABT3N478_9GAMM|nr:hypothetical protein [Endozoicomonas gorgoniicola]MCW7556448.1 hypothetical protein [Endozoicomonas gorgoniicola]MCW7556531.1 hypothetical protein [Endozoicomonas gorgoniicola]